MRIRGSKPKSVWMLGKYVLPAGFLCLLIVLYLLLPVHPVHRVQSRDTGHLIGVMDQPRSPSLCITSLLQHGHIIEIIGSTDPGAVVMINGQTASTIFEGNSFRYFVGPLRTGTAIISVSSQNQQGGVNTQQLAVAIN